MGCPLGRKEIAQILQCKDKRDINEATWQEEEYVIWNLDIPSPSTFTNTADAAPGSFCFPLLCERVKGRESVCVWEL